ncbi:hypothetical protein E3N88_39071 [Mikania micrantha]|uniref:Uncharacterized protein n=1 Tax=Mikania micrantha TaxID=192012 RepID=A0A5N6LVQ5_9ASTR|nr:hypothetical protein E3N88_39071 [Mikania micrantha]
MNTLKSDFFQGSRTGVFSSAKVQHPKEKNGTTVDAGGTIFNKERNLESKIRNRGIGDLHTWIKCGVWKARNWG